MPINKSECIGHTNKQRLISEFAIRPIAHLRLLPGQTKENCCGGQLTDQYFSFDYKNRNNENDIGGFFVGYDCGIQFFSLLGLDYRKYPLFDPLKAVRAGGTGPGGNGPGGAIGRETRDPLNQEIYDAIHILCTLWNTSPYGPVLNILNFVRDANKPRSQDWSVRTLNNIIGTHGETLREMIEDFDNNEHPWKRYPFTEMNNVINELLSRGEVIYYPKKIKQ